MKSSKHHRSHAGKMKVIFIKLIGGPKVTIVFFLTCGLFLLLSLIEKPGDIEPTSHGHRSRLIHHRAPSIGKLKVWSLEDYPLEKRVWRPSDYETDKPSPSCQLDKLLMVIVPSTPGQLDHRTAIRNTWGTLKKVKGPVYHQTVFVMGLPSDSQERASLLEESNKHKDVVFVNVADPYNNLSLNVQYGLYWAWTECKPSYLLKVPDDSFVNVKLLTNYLMANDRVCSKDLYVGRTQNSKEASRHPDKHKIAPEKATRGDFYPRYASGGGYLISGDVLEKMVSIAPYVPLLPVEDAYVGILAHLSGVNVTDSGRFTYYSDKWQICNYLYLMVIQGVSPDVQYLCLRYSEECSDVCAEQVSGRSGWE